MACPQDLNQFCEAHEIPKQMQFRLREYLFARKQCQIRQATSHALKALSPVLQVDVIMYVHKHWIDKIYFLRGVDEPCIVALAMGMKTQVYSPGEIVARRALYVVERGVALYAGKIITAGKLWGMEDVLLPDSLLHLSLGNRGRAMTFLDVRCLSREVLVTVASRFPRAGWMIRKAGIMLALRRFMIKAASLFGDRQEISLMEVVDKYADTMSTQPSNVHGDIIDRLSKAAMTAKDAALSSMEEVLGDAKEERRGSISPRDNYRATQEGKGSLFGQNQGPSVITPEEVKSRAGLTELQVKVLVEDSVQRQVHRINEHCDMRFEQLGRMLSLVAESLAEMDVKLTRVARRSTSAGKPLYSVGAPGHAEPPAPGEPKRMDDKLEDEVSPQHNMNEGRESETGAMGQTVFHSSQAAGRATKGPRSLLAASKIRYRSSKRNVEPEKETNSERKPSSEVALLQRVEGLLTELNQRAMPPARHDGASPVHDTPPAWLRSAETAVTMQASAARPHDGASSERVGPSQYIRSAGDVEPATASTARAPPYPHTPHAYEAAYHEHRPGHQMPGGMPPAAVEARSAPAQEAEAEAEAQSRLATIMRGVSEGLSDGAAFASKEV